MLLSIQSSLSTYNLYILRQDVFIPLLYPIAIFLSCGYVFDSSRDLTNLLTVVLLTRFLESIIPRATPHAKDSNAIAFLDTLTEQERRIYELRTNGIRELILWRRGMLRIIAADPNLMAMKITSRKRKAMTT